ncbi:hypothetical protein TNCV_798081 [Trichonephila clavipes]|nr:hypothetical protein TNCV_798081 [Trichonephila clavipes]
MLRDRRLQYSCQKLHQGLDKLPDTAENQEILRTALKETLQKKANLNQVLERERESKASNDSINPTDNTNNPKNIKTKAKVGRKSRFCCKGGAGGVGGRRQCRVELFRSYRRVELFSPADLSCFVPAAELSCFLLLSCFSHVAELSCFPPALALIFELRGRVELFSPTAKLSCF